MDDSWSWSIPSAIGAANYELRRVRDISYNWVEFTNSKQNKDPTKLIFL